MLENFTQHIATHLPFLAQKKLLIAVSGGLDSVVLSKLCAKLNYSFALIHCNFQLRDAESDEDEQFVIALAEELKVLVHTQKFDTKSYADKHKLSIQMTARTLRYKWFQEVAEKLGYDYILTAHHKDDALETFLINLSRGTGIEGLTGIPQLNQNIVRPLLPFSRSEILAYAEKNNWSWREDSSNATTKYVRNKIRHEIVPKLKELHPTFLDNFQRTQEHLRESQQIISDTIDTLRKKLVTKVSENVWQIEIEAIQQLAEPKIYLYELLKTYGFTAWNDVVELLEGQSGKQLFSPDFRLIKNRTHLLLQQQETNEETTEYLIPDSATTIQTPIPLQLEEVANVTDTSKKVLYLDKTMLKFPLIVRKWQKGDYFYPVGMKGKKKLSKYFKDEKYSLIEKEQQWLLCNEKDIVWIIGKRSDDRYKITQPTNTIIKLTLQ